MNQENREKLIYAPYHPEETLEEIMVELGMKSDSQDVEYTISGESDLMGVDTQDSVKTETQETFNIMPEYAEEVEETEEIIVSVTETDDYEFMPDINFDIYNDN